MHYNFSTQTAEVSGVKLKTGVAVVLSAEDKSHPKFGIVKNLFVVDNELILALHALEILEYSVHHHSWIVEESDRRSVMSAKSIPSRQVLTLRPIRDTFLKQFFVTLKYSL